MEERQKQTTANLMAQVLASSILGMCLSQSQMADLLRSSFVEGVIAVDISAHEILYHRSTFQGPNRWETLLGSGYLSKPALLTSSRRHVVHELSLSSGNRQKFIETDDCVWTCKNQSRQFLRANAKL